MKLLVLITGLLTACFVSGQNVLPVVKEGRWFLVDTTGNLLKQTDFSYIHTFDAAGYSYFAKNGAIGVVDSTGNVIVEPQYADVYQRGQGYYTLLSEEGWITVYAKDVKQTGETFESVRLLSTSWAFVEKDSSKYIQNLPTGKRWPGDSMISYNILNDHLYYWPNDSIEQFIDPGGNVLFSGDLIFDQQNDVFYVRERGKYYLFDANGEWPYRNITCVFFEADGVFIRSGNEGLYCGYDRSLILRGNYDIIGEFSEDYLFVTKAGLMTLVDRRTKRPVFPLRYEWIYPNDSTSYVVQKDGAMGLVDLQFREIIPCRYEFFVQRGDLLEVFDNGYRGIYSMKRRTELIPPVYNSIVQTGNRFKAQRNEFLSIIEIDDRHNILKTAKIDNVLVVRQAVAQSRERKAIDPRLFMIGWFLDSTLVQPAGKPSYYALKWGLRDKRDSVLIRPKFFDLTYIPVAPYTMYYTGKQRYAAGRGKTELHTYTPVYVPTAKYFPDLLLFSFDSTDFKRRDFMRVSSKDGFGILYSDGAYQPVAYIERGTNRYLRYCESKKIEPVKDNDIDEMTEVPSLSFYGYNIPHPVGAGILWPTLRGFQYPEGKWNYLAPDGKPLFEKPFVFAQPFLGKQAIVKTEKGWGVISPDMVLIPGIYSRVVRQISRRDTLFVVQKARPGNLLLDSLAKVVDSSPEIAGTGPHNFIITKEGRKFLCDEQLKPISEGYISMRFLKNGLILAKTKKEYTLLNSDGMPLYSGEDEPGEVYFEKAIVVKKGSGFTLCDLTLKVIAAGCAKVEQHGDFITAKKAGEWFAWNKELEPVLKEQEGQILVDTVTRQLAVVSDDRTTVYNSEGKRIARLKNIRPEHFVAGKLFVVKSDSCTIYDTNGKIARVLHGFQSLEALDNGDLFIKIRRGNNLVFQQDWTPVLPQETKFRSLKLLAPDIYNFQSASGKAVLYNHSTGRLDTTYRLIEKELFQGDRLLVYKGKSYQYIDRDFRPLTKISFAQATSFHGNRAAVGDNRGWTLIDHNGRALGYPYPGRITVLNKSFSQMPKPPFYGVFDSKGKELIPVIYEKVEFLQNDVILCVKEGNLFYFRKDGTPLLK